jgi:hypothetical protein
MGLFLRYGYGIFLAASASCLMLGQGRGPHTYPSTIAGQQISIAEQQGTPRNIGPTSAASSNPAQTRASIQGSVVDQFGAVMGSATVLFRAKASGGCDVEGGTAEFVAVTNGYGEFSVALPPGIYSVWVQGLHDCAEFTLSESSPPLTLKVSLSREEVDPSLPESRYKKIAGPAAINCGRAGIGKDRTPAMACGMRAYKDHKAFYVIFDEQGIDAEVTTGMSWNGKDVPYFVEYDSMGLSDYPLPVGPTQPDGAHTIVSRCSKPVRVFVNRYSELDCFKDKERWEQSILERGNRQTFLSAGETGYWELIPALKKRLVDPEAQDDPEDKEGILMALAKLGDRERMQDLVCELHMASPQEMQTVALDKISYVGGWYAIRIYRELLTPAAKARFEQARLREQSGLALSEPQWWALYSLPYIVEQFPPGIGFGFNFAQMPEHAQIWMEWIQKNERKLKTLEPTGAGVNFSGKTCKRKPDKTLY